MVATTSAHYRAPGEQAGRPVAQPSSGQRSVRGWPATERGRNQRLALLPWKICNRQVPRGASGNQQSREVSGAFQGRTKKRMSLASGADDSTPDALHLTG